MGRENGLCRSTWAAIVGLGGFCAGAAAQTPPEPHEPTSVPGDSDGAEGVDPADVRESVVQLNDGRRFTGELVRRDESELVLRIGGVDTAWRMADVASVMTQPSLREQYRQYRDAIDPSDTERLLVLARWLDARDMYNEAIVEIDRVLMAEPKNGAAIELRRVVQARQQLASKSRRPARPVDKPTDAAADFQKTFPILSPDQINIMRVFEVDLSNPPRMMVDRAAIDRLISGYASSPLIPTAPEAREALYRLPPAGVLDLMFQLRARELYGQVRVLDNPRSIELFRESVHDGWLINSCANTACHGGVNAGALVLRQRKASSDETVYTNLLILDRSTLHGKPLINYEAPAQSPLLHLAMRRDASLAPHPIANSDGGRADRWKPIFQSTDDRKFREAVAWIQAMYMPRPEYPIEYAPPAPVSPTDRPPNEPR